MIASEAATWPTNENSAMAWAVSPYADTGKNTQGYIEMLGTV